MYVAAPVRYYTGTPDIPTLAAVRGPKPDFPNAETVSAEPDAARREQTGTSERLPPTWAAAVGDRLFGRDTRMADREGLGGVLLR